MGHPSTGARPVRRRSLIRALAVAACATLLVTGAEAASAAGRPATPPSAGPWWDEDPAATQRARDLLARMTLEEKVDMMTGEQNFFYGFFNAAIPRLGIPALTMADGPLGVRVANPNVNGQRATQWPAPDARAATWDTGLEQRVGDLIGTEAFRTGHNVMLAPSVDIARHPQSGRLVEAYGEDPLLAGRMGAANIRGIQSHPVVATIKHYNVYNQETNRLSGGNAVVGERALQEIYTRPYEIGIQRGRPGAAMCAFNRVNGVYACENATLLNRILKQQLDFQGWMMSDYGATHSTAPAANAGLDQEQPGGTWFGARLVEAVRAGQVPQARVDDAVLRILRPMFGLGLFDQPVRIGPFPEQEHGRQARQVAENGMVLLRNRGLLPLDARRLDSVAVIGADADTVVTAGGSPLVIPTYTVSPLAAIRNRAGGAGVTHVAGNDPVNASALLPGRDPVPSSVLTPAGGGAAGTGLRAEYWANTTFAGDPALVRTDPYVGQNLGFFNFAGFNAQSPHLPVTPTQFNVGSSMRWTGTVTAPATGAYTLTLHSRGTGRVFLDGRQIIANPAAAVTTGSATVALVAGRAYDLRVEYANDYVSGVGDVGAGVKLSWTAPAAAVAPQIRRAADAARAADTAIVVVRDYASEGGDRPFLDLPHSQTQLIERVAAANPRTVVVLTTSGPTQTNTWEDRVRGVLMAWYGGQEQGNAIARILFGDVNPSGKLPVTFPVDERLVPVATPEGFPGVGGTSVYREDVFVGYRGYDRLRLPVQYPFGYGLSYTDFRYDGLRVDSRARTVSFTVRNTGRRAGAEVAQVYVGRLPTRVQTPPRQLAGWARVDLRAGRDSRVTVALDQRSLSYWDTGRDRWVTPAGAVPVYVGTSSRDIRLAGVIAVR